MRARPIWSSSPGTGKQAFPRSRPGPGAHRAEKSEAGKTVGTSSKVTSRVAREQLIKSRKLAVI